MDRSTTMAAQGPQSVRPGLALATAIVIAAGFVAICLQFSANYGDSLIYLVFAKSMQQGFFYYGSVGPKGGATSPLWAMTLSSFYWFGEPSVLLLKIVGVVLLAAAACGFLALSRSLSRDYLPGLVAMALYVSDRGVQSVTAGLYELPLATLLVALAILSTVRLFRAIRALSPATTTWTPWIAWAIANGLLPLARPECLLIVIADVLFIGYWTIASGRRSLLRFFLLVTLLPIGLTAWWNVFLYVHTGTLVPSSIAARRLSAMHAGRQSLTTAAATAMSIFVSTPLPWVPRLLGVVLLLSGLWSDPACDRDARILKWHLLACALVFPAVFTLFDPADYLARYMLVAKSIAFLLMGFGVVRLVDVGAAYLGRWKPARVSVAIALIALSIVYGTARAYESAVAYGRGIAVDVVLEKDIAERLNSIATRDQKVLVYEVQTQYYLVPEAISMDGIVGGEILPYLSRGSDLSDFLLRFKPDFIVVSNALDYRAEYRETILRRLFDADRTVGVGDEVAIDGFRFRKLFERPWESVPFPGGVPEHLPGQLRARAGTDSWRVGSRALVTDGARCRPGLSID